MILTKLTQHTSVGFVGAASGRLYKKLWGTR